MNVLPFGRGTLARPSASQESPNATVGPLCLIGDHELDPRCGCDEVVTPDLVVTLSTLKRTRQRRDALREALLAIGFESLSIVMAESLGSALVPVSALGGLPDASWSECYVRGRHHEVDPRWRDVSGSGLPCLWDMDSLRVATLLSVPCRHAERLVQDLSDAGARSGLLFALGGGSGSGRTIVELSSTRDGRSWMTDDVIGHALMLALFAQEHWPEIAQAGDGPSSKRALSDVEQGILHCVRQGLIDKVIADRLGLSTHNVDYHLRKLRQRFGVRNRVQLVQAAMRSAEA
jgi:DNA-binding CsgD family transcriptional regulator